VAWVESCGSRRAGTVPSRGKKGKRKKEKEKRKKKAFFLLF
jgi:hypothetical protein